MGRTLVEEVTVAVEATGVVQREVVQEEEEDMGAVEMGAVEMVEVARNPLDKLDVEYL